MTIQDDFAEPRAYGFAADAIPLKERLAAAARLSDAASARQDQNSGMGALDDTISGSGPSDGEGGNDPVSWLVSRNVTIGRHRTSMRLEPELWDALTDIAAREGLTIHEICTRVRQANKGIGLTSAVRILLISYFRARSNTPAAGSFDDLLGRTFTHPVAGPSCD